MGISRVGIARLGQRAVGLIISSGAAARLRRAAIPCARHGEVILRWEFDERVP